MRVWLVIVEAPEPVVKFKDGKPVSASGPDVTALLDEVAQEIEALTGKDVVRLEGAHALSVELTAAQVQEVRKLPRVAKVMRSGRL